MKSLSLALVIPAWNEQETICRAIREADLALSAIVSDYEIIIVDDGSTDNTAALVLDLAEMNPQVRLVRHPRNLGYGAALRTGFQAADCDLVAFTDADCQFDLKELAYMLPLTRRYDVTCGYRIDRQDPARRHFFSWGYNTLVQLLLGSPVHDIDCALKVFHHRQLPQILPECNNFFVNTEMLARARQAGLSIVEVGVHHRPRAAGKSKVSLGDIPKTLSALLPFCWRRSLFPAANPDREPIGGRTWAGLILLALLAGLLLFTNLSYLLLEPDEGRYAEIGREMLTSGDWIVPTLNHEPYLDKPPLLYWLVGGMVGLFGAHEWVVRLVPALSTFMMILATFFFGRRIAGSRAALLAAFVLTLMGGFILCGRVLILDSVLTLFVGLALFTGHEAIGGRRLRWSWWLASAFFCALGFLLKGPVAFILVAPPLAAQGWLNRATARCRLVHWIAYGALLGGLCAPWFIAIMGRCPDFAYHFFVDHHLIRFFGTEHHGQSPFWFYIPILLIGCLPWSLLFFPLSKFLFSRKPEVQSLRTQGMGFFLLWSLWCVVFFSLSRGKLPPYLLPAMPGIALLLGCFMNAIWSRGALAPFCQAVRRRAPQQIIILLALVWLSVTLWSWEKKWIEPGRLPLAVLEMALCAAGIVGIVGFGRKLPAMATWAVCCAVTICLLLEITTGFIPAWSYRRSPLSRSQEFAALVQDRDTGVVCVGRDWGSIPFHLNRDEIFFQGFGRNPEEVQSYLKRRSRNLLIADVDYPMERARIYVPEGMDIARYFDSGKARFFLIESQCQRKFPGDSSFAAQSLHGRIGLP